MRARRFAWYGLGLVLAVSCVLNPGPDLPGAAPARNPPGTGGSNASGGSTGASAGLDSSSGGTTPVPPGAGGTLPEDEPDAGMGADGGEMVDGNAGEGGAAGTNG